MKRFTGHTEGWGTFIDIKECNKLINLKKIKGKTIFISSVTDCYNPNEIYTKIYIKNDKSYWKDLAIKINCYCKQNNINFKNYFYHEEIRKNN